MATPTLTRRTVLNTAALATTALAMPFVHGAYAAGKLSCGFWDHWVPGANEPLAKLCREWADREKVELTIDFITSQGDKLALTATAEAQARSGHDVLQMSDWYVAAQADNLEPVDELVTSLIKEHGKLLLGSEYIGRQKGRWIAVPTGVQTTGQIPCARIDHFKQFVGLDLTKMYPAGAPPDEVLAEAWTWDGFLAAAEKCAKAGYPFGMPLSTWSDSVNWVSAVFAAQDAQLVDGEGNITVKSDEVKEVLEWFKKIVPLLPPSVFAWDNAANNKWLISGQGALIMNPPGAWAVAVRDAPGVAEQLWTFHSPKGPKGRFDPCSFGFWGIWNFSANVTAAKSLLTYLSTPPRLKSSLPGVMASTFRHSRSCATSGLGKMKSRQQALCTIIHRAVTSPPCSPAIRPQRASARRCSRRVRSAKWSPSAPSKVNRLTKQSSSPNPSSKGLCGREFQRGLLLGSTRRCDPRSKGANPCDPSESGSCVAVSSLLDSGPRPGLWVSGASCLRYPG
jgi:ABC-type glycerol-3-phosphate transport system substrate-binding protein